MGPARHAAVGVLLAAAALLLAAAVPVARSQAETEFSYIPGADNGPENWGKIKAEWANCSVGRMQSPIDLSDERAKLVRSLGYLDTSYRAAEATIVNTGHSVMVSFKGGDAGGVAINGTTYNLVQLHWHTPSEHTVDGHRYDLELHLVHQSSANKTAVIGILYEIGCNKDPFLHKLEPSIRRIVNTKDEEEDIGMVEPNVPCGSVVYYRYMGSLTTPPCNEGVVWTVLSKISPVAEYQVKLLRDALQDGNTMNARPLQEVNNRDISIFCPKPYDYI